MNPPPTENSPGPTIEQGIDSLLSDARSKACQTSEKCRERIRRSPGTAMAVAVAAGYCLHRLPVRSLLVAQVRLLAALAPPAVLAIGAAKLCEYLQCQMREKPRSTPVLRHAGELHGDV